MRQASQSLIFSSNQTLLQASKAHHLRLARRPVSQLQTRTKRTCIQPNASQVLACSLASNFTYTNVANLSSGGMDATPTYGPLRQRSYDFLSFLSVFTRAFSSISMNLSVSSIVLDDLTYNLPDNRGLGGSFKIHLTDGSQFSEMRRHAFTGTATLPETVALKMGLFKLASRGTDQEIFEDNQQIINSMATEVQILYSDYLRQHKNIVTLLGICWQNLSWQNMKLERRLIVPVLVLEAAEFGDLETFLESNNLTLIQRFQVAIDIANGLQAIHSLGIIHCDVKPGNILMFRSDKNGYTAKVADFGSSFLLKDAEETVTLPTWTQKWRAPEWDRLLHRENLIKTDLFSLGLVFWYVFTNSHIRTFLDNASRDGFNGKSLDELKACRDLLDIAVSSLREMGQEGNADSDAMLGIQIHVLQECLRHDPRHRVSDATEVVDDLLLGLRTATGSRVEQPYDPGASQTALSFCEIDDIVPVRHSLGTMRLLPTVVRNQITKQLNYISRNSLEAQRRRNLAAYEHAFLSISFLQFPGAERTDAIDLLAQAAQRGHFTSQSIVGRLAEGLRWDFDIDLDTETRWLEMGTIRGSRIAQKRLCGINEARCESATKILRDTYHGFGYAAGETDVDNLLDSTWLSRNARDRKGTVEELQVRIDINVDISLLPEYTLHILAGYGETELIRKFLEKYEIPLDLKNSFGETALLLACRSGQSEAAEFLLKAGADPLLSSNEGITCLHLLSLFENSVTPRFGRMLYQDKSLLEKRASSTVYSKRIDSRYARCEGTPLLWAVAADSIPACQILVDLGADPFDIVGGNLPVRNDWGGVINWSPVHLASRNHQHYLLDIMLHSTKLSPSTGGPVLEPGGSSLAYIKKQLCEGFRQVGTGDDAKCLPLLWAVDYSSGELMKRLLIHGENHETACKNTVDILLQYGANPDLVSRDGISAFEAATEYGQPFLTEHLSSIGDGRLLPSPGDCAKLYARLASNEDRAMFKTLQDLGLPLNGQAILRHVVEKTEDPYFVERVVAQLSREQPKHDYTPYFQGAVASGHLAIAEHLFETCYVRLHGCVDDEPFLGKLILQAKHFQNIDGKIKFVLKLSEGNDEEFFHCSDMMDSSLSLLQLSVITSEFRPNLTKSSDVAKVVLMKYNEPRYLNYQVPARSSQFGGYSALHLAVEVGNIDAIKLLLEEHDSSLPLDETLNLNLLTAKGESPVDLALERMKNRDGELENWDIAREQWQALDLQLYKNSTIILAMLREKGARSHKFLCVFTKTEATKVVLYDARLEAPTALIIMQMDLIEHLAQIPDPAYQTTMQPTFAKMRDLEVDHSFWLQNVPGSLQFLENIHRLAAAINSHELRI